MTPRLSRATEAHPGSQPTKRLSRVTMKAAVSTTNPGRCGSQNGCARATADGQDASCKPSNGVSALGDWTLVISGTGCHHNNNGSLGRIGLEEDADQRLLEFAERLARDGHTINNAGILHGGGADTVTFAYEGGILVPLEYIRADGTRENASEHLALRRNRRKQNEDLDGSTAPTA